MDQAILAYGMDLRNGISHIQYIESGETLVLLR